MPFNVCDRDGNHMGVIYEYYTGGYSTGSMTIYDRCIVMVAITEERLESHSIPNEKVLEVAAKIFQCMTIFGKVNESRLKEEMERQYNLNQDRLGGLNPLDFMKYMIMRDYRGFETNLPIPIDHSRIEGIIFLDIIKAVPKDGKIFLGYEKQHYLHEVMLENTEVKPVFAKVIDYPRLSLDVMGIGEGLLLGSLADLGGRNHTHETKLQIASGNATLEFSLPIHAYIKKGMDIQLYMKNKRLYKVFCDDIIYEV